MGPDPTREWGPHQSVLFVIMATTAVVPLRVSSMSAAMWSFLFTSTKVLESEALIAASEVNLSAVATMAGGSCDMANLGTSS